MLNPKDFLEQAMTATQQMRLHAGMFEQISKLCGTCASADELAAVLVAGQQGNTLQAKLVLSIAMNTAMAFFSQLSMALERLEAEQQANPGGKAVH